LDVGTGSGAIAVSVALECGCPVFASDISGPALQVAVRNRRGSNVSFFQADLLNGVASHSVDLLLSNPPYVPGADAANMQTEVRDWEPHVALFACDDGFEIYQRLIEQAEVVVQPGGRILMEMGYRSLDRVRAMLETRWTEIDVMADLAGLPRVIAATLR
jgi:release factor glutamine methyltransferase